MAVEPDNIVLAYLRRLDEKVDRLGVGMLEVKSRLGILEEQYASIPAASTGSMSAWTVSSGAWS
jgi:hypothetical protein